MSMQQLFPEPVSSNLPNAVFFHVGRTGGTSVNFALKEFYGENFLVQQQPLDFSLIDQINLLPNHTLVSGHFHIKPFLENIPSDWKTFTLLRSPLTHICSIYHHLRTTKSPSKADWGDLFDLARKNDLLDFFNKMKGSSSRLAIDNPLTRFVLGAEVGNLSSDSADKAIDLLDELDLVGIREYLTIFIDELASLLNISNISLPFAFKRVNTNPSHHRPIDILERRALHTIMSLTEIDSVVFDHFQKKTEKRIVKARNSVLSSHNTLRDSSVPEILVADVFRVDKPRITKAGFGVEFQILGTEMLLHPPRSGAASASATVLLEGHTRLEGIVFLDHPAAQPVRFTLELSVNNQGLISEIFEVSALESTHVVICFPQSFGIATLCLSTEMRDANHGNSYAWAKFCNFKITGLDVSI